MSAHAAKLIGVVVGVGISALGSHIGTSFVGRRRVPGGSPWYAGEQLLRCGLWAVGTAIGAVWAILKGRNDLAIAFVLLGVVFVALTRYYRHRLETMREQNRDDPGGLGDPASPAPDN